jgi:hypothetical protein
MILILRWAEYGGPQVIPGMPRMWVSATCREADVTGV